jgi:hypothetical protein
MIARFSGERDKVEDSANRAVSGDISMLTCLICGGDMRQDTDEVAELLRQAGCVSTTAGSDGRRFLFSDGEELEVGGTCNACDEIEIRKFLESR